MASVSQEHCAPFPKGRAEQRNGVLMSWSTFPIYPFHSRPKLKTELGDPPRAPSGHGPAPQKSSSFLPRRFGAPTRGKGVLPGCSQPCPQLLQRPLALGLVRRLPLIDSLKPPSCIITEIQGPILFPESLWSVMQLLSQNVGAFFLSKNKWIGIKSTNEGEFPGSPLVRIPCFHCMGSGLIPG